MKWVSVVKEVWERVSVELTKQLNSTATASVRFSSAVIDVAQISMNVLSISSEQSIFVEFEQNQVFEMHLVVEFSKHHCYCFIL